VRIIIWHGYLLGGTGSNVYTRALARSWSHAGHDVVVLCQEPEPGAFDLGGARVQPAAHDVLRRVDRGEALQPRQEGGHRASA